MQGDLRTRAQDFQGSHAKNGPEGKKATPSRAECGARWHQQIALNRRGPFIAAVLRSLLAGGVRHPTFNCAIPVAYGFAQFSPVGREFSREITLPDANVQMLTSTGIAPAVRSRCSGLPPGRRPSVGATTNGTHCAMRWCAT